MKCPRCDEDAPQLIGHFMGPMHGMDYAQAEKEAIMVEKGVIDDLDDERKNGQPRLTLSPVKAAKRRTAPQVKSCRSCGKRGGHARTCRTLKPCSHCLIASPDKCARHGGPKLPRTVRTNTPIQAAMRVLEQDIRASQEALMALRKLNR